MEFLNVFNSDKFMLLWFNIYTEWWSFKINLIFILISRSSKGLTIEIFVLSLFISVHDNTLVHINRTKNQIAFYSPYSVCIDGSLSNK